MSVDIKGSSSNLLSGSRLPISPPPRPRRGNLRGRGEVVESWDTAVEKRQGHLVEGDRKLTKKHMCEQERSR